MNMLRFTILLVLFYLPHQFLVPLLLFLSFWFSFISTNGLLVIPFTLFKDIYLNPSISGNGTKRLGSKNLMPEIRVSRQRAGIGTAILRLSAACHLASVAFPGRVMGFWPPLHRISLFVGCSQTTHSSSLAAKGQTSPARTYCYPSRSLIITQHCPYKDHLSSLFLLLHLRGSQPYFSSPA